MWAGFVLPVIVLLTTNPSQDPKPKVVIPTPAYGPIATTQPGKLRRFFGSVKDGLQRRMGRLQTPPGFVHPKRPVRGLRKTRDQVSAASKASVTEAPESTLESDAAFAILGEMIQKTGPKLVQKLGATVQFNVTSLDSAATCKARGKDKFCDVQRGWVLDLSGKGGAEGELREGFEKTADLHMVADDGVMMDIAYGRINPKLAFLRGQLRMTPVSRVALAIKFDSLIQEWREELLGYTKLYKGSVE